MADGDRKGMMSARRRFAIALAAALGLHGAIVLALVDLRMPAPRTPVVMVGILAEAPRPKPVEPPSRPTPPQRPVRPQPPTRSTPVQTKAESPQPVPKAVPTSEPAVAPEPPAPTEPAADSRPAQPSAPAPAAPAVPAPDMLVAPVYHADYLHNPEPAYPLLSRKRGETGEVRLRVRVGVNGRAESVAISASSGYPRLDLAALDAVRAWRFVPAHQGGRGVAAWVEVPITFNLER